MKNRLLLLLGLAGSTACMDESPSDFGRALVDCEFGAAATLPVGGILADDGGGAAFCIDGGATGGTYLLVPFVAGTRDTLNRMTVSIFGGGLSAPAAATRPVAGRAFAPAALESDAFHSWLRAREMRDLPLSGIARVTRRPAMVPLPGETMLLGVSTDCLVPDARQGRVVAISNHSIILDDLANPRADAYTDAELSDFAREFDDLVWPVLTETFGSPTDIDGNGRVIVFFTRAVNEIEIPGSAAAMAGGYHWTGNLIPSAGLPGRAPGCASSNEAEVLYLAVPDSAGAIRVPKSKAGLKPLAMATIGHELQHLINAGRRIYVVNGTVLEDTWLNEGLSHIAEELLFYAAAGLSPRQNIDTTTIYASRSTAAFNRFMYSNLGRLDAFLQAPQDWSMMGRDAVATRGATWAFLRYAADRDPRPDAQFFRALIDSHHAGLDNLKAGLGEDPIPWIQDWALSLFEDDQGSNPGLQYQFPSWKLRELIAALRLVDQTYPLRLLPLSAGDGFSLRMQSGSAAFTTFAVPPRGRALVRAEPDRESDGRTLWVRLLRTQ